MPRQLKTFVTNLGFFELAIAAPSMKAALEAWGMSHNAFQHGFAKQTDDPKIVAATNARAGTVLRRPVGTTGAFSENAELPKQLWKGTLPKSQPVKKKAKPQPKSIPPKRNEKAERAGILSFEVARQKRERDRDRKNELEAARQQKDQARIERAVAKAEQAFQQARERHDSTLAEIETQREKLDRRETIEKQRWEKERHRLEEARERATD